MPLLRTGTRHGADAEAGGVVSAPLGPGVGHRYEPDAQCAVEDCSAKPRRRHLCQKHFSRWRRHGDPSIDTRPPYEPILGERWRIAPGTGDRYEVSDHGRVRSRPGVHYGDRLATVRLEQYAVVRIHLNGKRRVFNVHRLVALAFLGPPPPGHECRHLDGNKWNPHLSNLAWGTKSENAHDMIRHGVHPSASKTHCIRGHEFTPENTRRDAKGHRACRKCERARRAVRTEREAA